MINRSLTLEDAIERAGELRYLECLEIGPEHPLVVDLFETRDAVVNQMIESGDLKYSSANTLRGLTERGKAWKLKYYDVIAADFFTYLEEIWPNGPEEELVHNSIIHGTGYCSSGWVFVRGLEGIRGTLWVIDQMNSSVSAEELLHKIEAAPSLETYDLYGTPMRLHGIGLSHTKSSSKEINVQNFEGGYGF
jgi:hypothetical protein